MANVTVLTDDLQGLTTVITLTGSTVVPLASGITVVRAGSGYFYKGAVVDSTLIGNAGIIAALTAAGAIQ